MSNHVVQAYATDLVLSKLFSARQGEEIVLQGVPMMNQDTDVGNELATSTMIIDYGG